MSDTKTHGCLTFAFGYAYERMAYALALSLRPYGLPLTVVVSKSSNDSFALLSTVANVIELEGYYSKFSYEGLAYKLSPYTYTLKLDADMLMPAECSLTKYFELATLTGVCSGVACNLVSQPSSSVVYRKIETGLDLPTIYSAAFVFTKGDLAKQFFDTVTAIFGSWFQLPELSKLLPPTTDTVYSLAWKSLGLGEPTLGVPFLHMKKGVAAADLPESWVDVLPYSIDSNFKLRVNSHQIRIPFHYYDKRFLSDSLLTRLTSCTQ